MNEDPRLAVRRLIRRVTGFAAASGIGLALDFGLFLLLVEGKQTPASANLVSATAAVSFVYFATVHRVFSYRGRLLLLLFIAYLAFQAIAVTAASVCVGYLACYWMVPALAKLAILPATFSANFLFMSWLTKRRESAVVEGE